MIPSRESLLKQASDPTISEAGREAARELLRQTATVAERVAAGAKRLSETNQQLDISSSLH